MQIICPNCGDTTHQPKGNNNFKCNSCLSVFEHIVINEEQRLLLANAARLLRAGEFDEAEDQYRDVLSLFPDSHEALYSLALCKHGIVFVDDLLENKKVPTCYKIIDTSFIEDEYFKKALKAAPQDVAASYKMQGDKIEAIRREWVEISSKERPYDVFISFKASDKENGLAETPDKREAQMIYTDLTREGYNVFFSPQSLRDKVAERYEPYIYNALETAPVMILYGEKRDYFEATWVKNEWKRFLKKIVIGEKARNSLIVVYQNMHGGDLPSELRGLQGIDLSVKQNYRDLFPKVAEVIKKSRADLHKLKIDTVEIKSGQVAKKAASARVDSIETVELGTYKIGTVSVSENAKIQAVEDSIAHGNFEYALETIQDTLMPEGENNYKVLFLQLKAQNQCDDNSFFYRLSNFSDKEKIDKLLNCAEKEFAEKFINNWIEILILKGTTQDIMKHLEYLAKFKVSSRAKLIDHVEKVALNTRDEALIKMTENCFDKNDVDRFVKFYYALGGEEYFKKAIALDEGHLDSLFALFEIQYLLNDNIHSKDAQEAAMHIYQFKHCTPELRESHLDKIIKVLLLSCEKDKKRFKEHVDYYLKLYKKGSSKQKHILTKLYQAMQEYGFWFLAEEYCATAININDKNENLHFDLLQIKLHCYSADELAFVAEPKLRQVNEFNNAFALAAEHDNTHLTQKMNALAARQFENIKSGNTKPREEEHEFSVATREKMAKEEVAKKQRDETLKLLKEKREKQEELEKKQWKEWGCSTREEYEEKKRKQQVRAHKRNARKYKAKGRAKNFRKSLLPITLVLAVAAMLALIIPVTLSYPIWILLNVAALLFVIASGVFGIIAAASFMGASYHSDSKPLRGAMIFFAPAVCAMGAILNLHGFIGFGVAGVDIFLGILLFVAASVPFILISCMEEEYGIPTSIVATIGMTLLHLFLFIWRDNLGDMWMLWYGPGLIIWIITGGCLISAIAANGAAKGAARNIFAMLLAMIFVPFSLNFGVVPNVAPAIPSATVMGRFFDNGRVRHHIDDGAEWLTIIGSNGANVFNSKIIARVGDHMLLIRESGQRVFDSELNRSVVNSTVNWGNLFEHEIEAFVAPNFEGVSFGEGDDAAFFFSHAEFSRLSRRVRGSLSDGNHALRDVNDQEENGFVILEGSSIQLRWGNVNTGAYGMWVDTSVLFTYQSMDENFFVTPRVNIRNAARRARYDRVRYDSGGILIPEDRGHYDVIRFDRFSVDIDELAQEGFRYVEIFITRERRFGSENGTWSEALYRSIDFSEGSIYSLQGTINRLASRDWQAESVNRTFPIDNWVGIDNPYFVVRYQAIGEGFTWQTRLVTKRLVFRR